MKTIVAPIDFSSATGPILEAAGALARLLSAKIVLLHVIRPPVIVNEYSALTEAESAAEEQKNLEKLAYWKAALQHEGFPVDTDQLFGPPAVCIRDTAARLSADYIVIGSHGHGAVYDLLIGSTATELMRKAPCPVLVVPVACAKAPAAGSESDLELHLQESAGHPGHD